MIFDNARIWVSSTPIHRWRRAEIQMISIIARIDEDGELEERPALSTMQVLEYSAKWRAKFDV